MRYHHAPPALRTYRRSWGLSQRELAELLGFADRTAVSRIEHGKRVPLFQTALACAALFDASLDELFPQLYLDTEEKLHDKVAQRMEGSAQPATPAAARKQELFSRALART